MTNELHPELTAFLKNYPFESQTLALAARKLIREVMPETVELLDPSANLIAYGLDRGYKGLICGITLFSSYVNIMLAQGASMPDPHGLLKGTGKLARHVKVTQAADLLVEGVRELLAAAYEKKLAEWKQAER